MTCKSYNSARRRGLSIIFCKTPYELGLDPTDAKQMLGQLGIDGQLKDLENAQTPEETPPCL